jgi:hypothetical protein
MRNYGILPSETRAFEASYDETSKILAIAVSTHFSEGKGAKKRAGT